ncbi:TetR/AcrR family transcriptional regulator [Streptomyces sp. NPDC058683]|uniref:TetR/AcrR family transcriptional regulator n=1 Tax=Streptomyces sp. NPDC058683 TaxID=3346597 RepID=UPI00364FD09F
MTNADPQRRRRMTPVRRAEIYEAVLALLKDVGYEALTMDAVAIRTGCGKATLYRWWGGKPELVVRAIRHESPEAAPVADTGSLRGDLHALLALEDDRTMERRTALLRSVAMAVNHDRVLLEGVRSHLVGPQTAAVRHVIQRAIGRGEVAADCAALPFVTEVTLGALIARTLFEGEPPTQVFLAAYVDAVLVPALTAPARRS